MAENLFKKYYKRVAREGMIKAVFCGLIVGFAVLAVVAALSWFFGFKEGLWVSLAAFVVVAGGTVPLFYVKRFRPTSKAIAKRVDELGLEERVLTMTELENDTSYIALKQREDTVNALHSVDHMLVKIVVSASLCVAVCAMAVVGIGMATVDTLHYVGVIPSGLSLLEKTFPVDEFTVTYTALEGGEVFFWANIPDMTNTEREMSESVTQRVESGADADAVIAVPANGYVFIGWSDGIDSPYRQDLSVRGNTVYVAVFEKVDDAETEEPDDPDMNSSNSGNNNQDMFGGMPQQGDPTDKNGGGEGDGAGGGRDAESNKIIDGNIYYGDEFDGAHKDAMDRLGQDTNMPDDMKDWVSDYYDSIEKGGGGNSGNSDDADGSNEP